jgi:hypothetical protein
MTHEPSMLERVAVAMQAKYVRGDALNFDELARAAVEALRELSSAVAEHGEEAIIYHPEDIIRNQAEPAWHAMITSILEGN